ncbi:hypothetical protein LTS08_004972 [Lithohypha guttulata]|nr:hypothetical protein LTS08_004972 [Lithohypha guttulata]
METSTAVKLPKVAIRFCVQCKWNLRAAYYAQELLQTFSETLGEVSLIPVTGGTFTINLYTGAIPSSLSEENSLSAESSTIADTLIWDRKRDGGFPETKELKNRVRNVIDPNRDMGHVDRALKKGGQGKPEEEQEVVQKGSAEVEKQQQGHSEPSHAEHKARDSAPADCEECIEAAKEDQPANEAT